MAINWNRYKRYDTSEGFGNANEWKKAFNKKITGEEAAKIMSQSKEDEWSILGIQPGSNLDAIKKAFRAKIQEFHPDKNPDNLEKATEKTRQILAAYEILKAKNRRQAAKI